MSTQAKIARFLKNPDMYHSNLENNHNIFDMQKMEKFRVSSRYVSDRENRGILKPWVSMNRLSSSGERDPFRRSFGKGGKGSFGKGSTSGRGSAGKGSTRSSGRSLKGVKEEQALQEEEQLEDEVFLPVIAGEEHCFCCTCKANHQRYNLQKQGSYRKQKRKGSSSTAPAPAPPPGTGKENGHTNGISKTENTASQEGINNDTSPVTANGSAVSGSVPSLTTPTSQGSQGSGREVEGLKSEVSLLRKELSKCRDTISKLQEKEKQMRDRLCEQASRQLEKGTTKFEDLNLGDNRPTQLIRRFGNLYSEVRLDAFDALDDLPEIAEFDDLKGKLLFSVVVLGFRAAQKGLQDMKARVHSLLYIPASDSDITDPLAKEMDDMVAVYLRKTVDKYDMRPLIEDVCAQVYSTLYDYPCLKACEGLHTYIEESVRLAWALSVQNPPLVIDFDSKLFKDDMHTRFHSSDPESNQIASVLWPALLEGDNGQCVHKGVVIT